MPKKLDRYEFIWKSIQKHGYKYDYRKVDYKGSENKVCIICHEHGEFYVTPDKHINRKTYCPICTKMSLKKRFSKSIDTFITESKIVHGNKYDYSKVEYKGTNVKICIVCSEHGLFWQSPKRHLQGDGCSKCSNRYHYDSNEFIKRSNVIHNNKYDYSNIEYFNTEKQIYIICNVDNHGGFWQKPYKHLQGQGCPKCSESKLEKQMSVILEDMNIKFKRQEKFKWLIFKSKMSVDFYLTDYNVAIECQGEQHFFPVDFGNKGNEYAYNLYIKVKKRDKVKQKLCKENNINIIYINYFDTEEEIKSKLKNLENGS